MTTTWYKSLRVQIVLLLTLALLPIGAVAIYQTNRVAADSVHNAELTLLALTGRAAKQEELVLERAFGVAGILGTIAGDYLDDPDRCRRALSSFLNANLGYSFIGVLPLSGQMTCSSADRPFDFSGFPNFETDITSLDRSVVVNRDGPISGQSVFVVSEPFSHNGVHAGRVSVSIPHANFELGLGEMVKLGLVELITFNADGEILTARDNLDTATRELPSDHTLQALKNTSRTVFQSANQSGDRRIYTVVPIEGSPVAVLAVWDTVKNLGDGAEGLITSAVFPTLMWIASMAVAMLSIHTLVLRHVKTLRQKMSNFADNRALVRNTDPTMPSEIRELTDKFDQMTDAIIHEEAKLENTLREKNVLIKEVHHRVKNNLQLISSITNMQIRAAEHDETKSVLGRLQDRVLSLATIHRDLYQSEDGGLVNAGALVEEIVMKAVEGASAGGKAVTQTTDFDKVLLYPDQAMPLSLLMAECITNTMKYVDTAEGLDAWVSVNLEQEGPDCIVTLANSVNAGVTPANAGLGAQLINAFAIQLGGEIVVEKTDDSYTMSLRFEIAEFAHEARDY